MGSSPGQRLSFYRLSSSSSKAYLIGFWREKNFAMAKLSHVQEMGLWTRQNTLAEGGVFRGKENTPRETEKVFSSISQDKARSSIDKTSAIIPGVTRASVIATRRIRVRPVVRPVGMSSIIARRIIRCIRIGRPDHGPMESRMTVIHPEGTPAQGD